MKNYAIIDYDARELHLFFRGEEITFDLTQGDIGEFIYGFETKDGKFYDLNYTLSEFGEDVCVYGITEEIWGFPSVNTLDYTFIRIHLRIGDENSYLNQTENKL
jgi:hypothetical protein